MEQLYNWNATFALLDNYKVLAKKNVFVLQKKKNPEKIGIARLAGEESMLHCTEGLEACLQMWTSESCCVRICVPSLQQARCRMKEGIA